MSGLRNDHAPCILAERGEGVRELRPELHLDGEIAVEVEAVQQIRSELVEVLRLVRRQSEFESRQLLPGVLEVELCFSDEHMRTVWSGDQLPTSVDMVDHLPQRRLLGEVDDVRAGTDRCVGPVGDAVPLLGATGQIPAETCLGEHVPPNDLALLLRVVLLFEVRELLHLVLPGGDADRFVRELGVGERQVSLGTRTAGPSGGDLLIAVRLTV